MTAGRARPVHGSASARRRGARLPINGRLFPQALTWILVLCPVAVSAHIDPAGAGAGGFVSGLRHPVTGLDHVIAMVAVGLWGAQLGAPAMWILPVVFPVVMAVGGVLGVLAVGLPGVDVGVAVSALLLGGAVAAEVRPPLAVAMVMVGVFAIFHGYAHGTALPTFGVPILFASGFVLVTGLLHLCGILIGLLGRLVIRVAGAAIALVGGYFLAVHLGAV